MMKGRRSDARDRQPPAYRRARRGRLGGSIAVGALVLGATLAFLVGLPRPEDLASDRPVAPSGTADVVLSRAPPAGCAADKPAADARRFKKALSCLRDLDRRNHGVRKLRSNDDLGRVALHHARDMIRRHYFDHRSPGGGGHMDRIADSRYKPAAGCWSAGENLYYSRHGTTPRHAMRVALNSPEHRRNILGRRWKDVGSGVVSTSPYGDPDGVTVVVLYGTRFSGACHVG